MILVIDRSKKNANAISDMFYFLGVLSKAISPQEVFYEISSIYRAIVVLSPESLPSPFDFIENIRKYNKTAPVFAYTDSKVENAEVFDMVLSREVSCIDLLNEILEYTRQKHLPQPGVYRIMGLDISSRMNTTFFFEEIDFNFTRTEAMIIRYLIRAYPTPTTANKILKYAFRDSRTPEISNIRTHISIINKKYRTKENRNLIQMLFGKGYQILTPEVISDFSSI